MLDCKTGKSELIGVDRDASARAGRLSFKYYVMAESRQVEIYSDIFTWWFVACDRSCGYTKAK